MQITCIFQLSLLQVHMYRHIQYLYTGHTDTGVKKISAGSDSLVSEYPLPLSSSPMLSRVVILCTLSHHCPPVSCPLGPGPQHPKCTRSI